MPSSSQASSLAENQPVFATQDAGVHRKTGYPSLEALRFIASVAIVIFHYTYYFQKRALFKGYLAVDLFFVLSGFVIALAYQGRVETWRSYGTFLRKRFARLYPLHFLTLSIYVLIALAASVGLLRLVGPGKYRFSELIYQITLTHAWGFAKSDSFNTVSWSISAELGAYLLFPLLWRMIRRGRISGFATVCVLYSFGAYFAWTVYHQSLMQLYWNFGVFRALAGFSLGLLLFANLPALSRRLSSRACIAGFYLSLAAWIGAMGFSLNDYLGAAFAAMLVAFAAIADAKRVDDRICLPWMSKHGELTYSIYMIHPLVATIWISGLAPRLLGTHPAGITAAILVAMAVTYGLSRLSYTYFEVPARQWAGGSRPREIVREDTSGTRGGSPVLVGADEVSAP